MGVDPDGLPREILGSPDGSGEIRGETGNYLGEIAFELAIM